MKKIITLSIALLLYLTASVFAANDSKEMNSAIEAGDIAKVKALLDGGYNPNTLVPNGQPPVMVAANTGNAEIVSMLIKAGADVSLQAEDYLGGNALTGAVWSTGETHNPANTIKIIQLLLDAGIDINSGEVRDESGDEKDIVCVNNDNFSIEIKTSSNKNRIFANRSYAQGTINGKKSKTGYYLAVNFENSVEQHQITLIRFGWIDAQDWKGQVSQKGQQAHLEAELERLKLKTIYKSKNN